MIDFLYVKVLNASYVFCRTLMMFARSYFCKVKEWVRKCILTMKKVMKYIECKDKRMHSFQMVHLPTRENDNE